MTGIQTLRAGKFYMSGLGQHFCSHCSLSEICLPMGVNKQDLQRLENLVQQSRVQHNGDIVLRQGDTFHKVFAVKSGMYKSTRIDRNGQEMVTAFHLPGELIGLDAIYEQKYPNTTTALDTSVLCELDYDQLTELSASIPALQRQLLRLLSKEINKTSERLEEQTAEQKLAGFIHNLAKRYEVRGYSGREMILAMTRQDIANHLGMAAETLSRLLKRLQHKGILSIKKREVTLTDEAALMELIGCEATSIVNTEALRSDHS